MPPKGKAKAKAKGVPKANAKGKAKAKAKAKASGKAAAKAKAAKVVVEEPAEEEQPTEEQPTEEQKKSTGSRGGGLLKKILDEAGGKPFTEVVTEHKRRLFSIDATIAEATALEEAQSAQAASAKKELDEAASKVRALEEEEQAIVKKLADIKSAKVEAAATTAEKTKDLQESQNVLRMVEAMSSGKKKQREAEMQLKAAAEMEKEARQKQKETIQATKAAIAEAASALKGRGKGTKRPSTGGASPKAKSPKGSASKTPKEPSPDEADTVPATLQEGDAEDIE